MKIAIWHNLPSGGGKRALYSHVKGLLEQGHHLEAWCPPTADREYLRLNYLIQEHVVPLDWPDRHNQSRGGAFAALGTMRRKLRAMDQHCKGCAAEMATGNFDILFANSCGLLAASPIARYAALPSVLYLQEPYRIFYEALPDLPWRALPAGDESFRHWKRVIGDAIRVQALRLQARDEVANAARFDQILVNSLFSRESVARAYGIDAQVCYLGIDETVFYPTGELKENYIVGLGSVTYGKGPERTIRAIGAIPSEGRPRLVWVGNFGDASYLEAVQQLAREHGVNLTIKVRIADEEIRSILSRAALLIYTPRLEPFGYAPLEANACGTPVVAIAEGGIRETVVDGVTGFMVTDANAEALAAAMQRLLNNKELAQRFGEAGLELVRKKWNLTDANKRLESVLLRVAKR